MAISRPAIGKITTRSRPVAWRRSAVAEVVPPTSTVVPGGAAAWAASRSGSTASRASAEDGFMVSSRSTCPTSRSGLSWGGRTWPTPSTRWRAAPSWATAASSSGWSPRTKTWVGLRAPAGKPDWRSVKARRDSVSEGSWLTKS